MKFDFHKELVRIWGYAVELYRDGHQDACQFPIEEDVPFLESIGMNRMDVFDFAEDSRTAKGLFLGDPKEGTLDSSP